MPDLDFSSSSKFKMTAGILALLSCGFFISQASSFIEFAIDPEKQVSAQQAFGWVLKWSLWWQNVIVFLMPLLILLTAFFGLAYFGSGCREWWKEHREKENETKSISSKIDVADAKRSADQMKGSAPSNGPGSIRPYESDLVSGLSKAAAPKFDFSLDSKVGKFRIDLIAKPLVRSPLSSRDLVVGVKQLNRGGRINWLTSEANKLSLLCRLYSLEKRREAFPILLIIASKQTQARMGLGSLVRKLEHQGLAGSGILAVRPIEPEKVGKLSFDDALMLLRES